MGVTSKFDFNKPIASAADGQLFEYLSIY